MRKIMLLVGWTAGVLVVAALLLDEGHVVTLLTHGEGREYETQVWVVEQEDVFYIRSNEPDSEWLERIDSDPNVGIKWTGGLHEQAVPFHAQRVSNGAVRDRVSDQLARKHGFADRVRGLMVDRQESVVLELVPLDRSEAAREPAATGGAKH